MNETVFAIKEELDTVSLKKNKIKIIAVSDNQQEIKKAFNLWYEIYIDELKMDTNKGVCHQNKTLSIPQDGSLYFLAMNGDKCVGTLKANFNNFTENDFNYNQIFPNVRVGELSKLLVNKDYRKTFLSAYLLTNCYNFNKKTGIEKQYDIISMNCIPELYFYYRLFGFKRVSKELYINPGLDKKGRHILFCTKEKNKKAVADLKKLVKDSKLVKVKWGIKYWWYKKIYA